MPRGVWKKKWLMRRSSGPLSGGACRQQKLAPKALAQADVRRLLKEVELRADVRDQAILYTLLYTGLRVGELAHLRVEDVTLSERKGTIVVRGEHAKGGKQREVPVPHEARERLVAYLDQHPTGKGILFLGQRGPLGEDAVGRIVGKYATWAELRGCDTPCSEAYLGVQLLYRKRGTISSGWRISSATTTLPPRKSHPEAPRRTPRRDRKSAVLLRGSLNEGYPMADIRSGSVENEPEPLTSREHEILACLAEGLSKSRNRQPPLSGREDRALVQQPNL